MSVHLSAALRDFAADQGRAAAVRAPDTDIEVRDIVSRVRRRRLARAATIAASAAAVLVLGAVAVYGLTSPEPMPPVDSPSPVHTQEPSPPQTPTPAPDGGTVTSGIDTGVTVHPLLPAAQPLEPGMLAAAPRGSSLVTFQATCGYPCSTPTSPQVTYLVTPDGGHFELRLDMEGGLITDWLPGTSRLLITRWMSEGSAELLVVDADTGEALGEPFPLDADTVWLGPHDDVYSLRAVWSDGAASSRLERRSLDGDVLAELPLEWYESVYDARNLRLIWNETRTLALYTTDGLPGSVDDAAVVLRTPSLEIVPLMPLLVDPEAHPSYAGRTGAISCKGLGWVTSTEALLVCAEFDSRVPWDQPGYLSVDAMWRVSPDGAASRLGDWRGQPWPHRIEELQPIGERIVGWRRAEDGGRSMGEVTAEGRFVELSPIQPDDQVVGVAGTGLVVLSRSPATGGWGLELRNPFTGASQALLAPKGEAILTYPSIVTGTRLSHG